MRAAVCRTVTFCWTALLLFGTAVAAGYEEFSEYWPAGVTPYSEEIQSGQPLSEHRESTVENDSFTHEDLPPWADSSSETWEKYEAHEEETIASPNGTSTLDEPIAGADELLDWWREEMERALAEPSDRYRIKLTEHVQNNHRVLRFVDAFRGHQRGFFERALARSGRYIPIMQPILREERLPENLVYLALIESGFSPYAYSRAKAMGYWQFMRGTALRYGLKIDSWVDERRDPVLSTRAAAAYLKDLHQLFGEWFLAAAAYNAGEGRVGRALERSRTSDFWRLSQERRYLALETRNYVPKFIAAAIIAEAPEKHGFGEIVYEPPLEYDELAIEAPMRLTTIARLAGTDVKEIKRLNPALLRDFTPPDRDTFTLRLPVGKGERFWEGYALLPPSAKIKTLKLHTVRKGETLSSIAKNHGQSVQRLIKDNNLKTTRIRPGQELVVVR